MCIKIGEGIGNGYVYSYVASHHMQHGGKSKSKGQGFGFLDKGMDLCASFVNQLL
jgi:hypothetical protein